MAEATELKYGIEVTFNNMTSLLNFFKSTNWLKHYWSETQTDCMVII
jgi:hypothetical protein